jgi:fatty acid desaturase
MANASIPASAVDPLPEDTFAKSSARAVATITAEYGLIGLGMALGAMVESPYGYACAVLLIGTRQYALGECMAHEASHRNLSRRRWLNEALGIVVSWPFFFTLHGYRRFHNSLHHGINLKDANNSIYEDYQDWGLPPDEVPLGRVAAYWYLVGKPLLGVVSIRHLIKTIADFYWDSDLRENTAMLIFWVAVFVLVAYLGLLAELFLYWIVPLFVVVPVLNYWSEVGDHYRVTNAATRSNLNWCLNTLVAHNIGYHALHHHRPSIPWFRLRRSYPVCRHELQEQVSGGYWMTFRQIMAEERRLRSEKPATPVATWQGRSDDTTWRAS